MGALKSVTEDKIKKLENAIREDSDSYTEAIFQRGMQFALFYLTDNLRCYTSSGETSQIIEKFEKYLKP